MHRVLIIDDEFMIREGLRLTIDWQSMDCIIAGEAEDGEEGLKLIKELKPDIIITDIRMPGLSGLDMISAIKKEKQSCKIIILTGYRDFEYAQQAIRLGAFRFLLKPSKEEEILDALRDAIKELDQKKSDEKLLSNYKTRMEEFYDISNNKKETIEDINKSSYLVKKAINYMKENYSNNIGLQTVADKLYISTWYLSKLLKKETGSTFIDVLNNIRINESKRLLEDPKYKIYEICNIVGFADTAYFVKLFKKICGITPTDYRNLIANK